MKKPLCLFVLAAALGLVCGIGVAVWRVQSAPWDGDPGGETDPAAALLNSTPGPLPKVLVDRTDYDFGKMDSKARGSHAFVFHNTGPGPLRLIPAGTSCGCTDLDVKDEEIGPGDSTEVVVKWTAKPNEGVYEETAMVRTNDPTRPRVTLTISGEIVVAVRAVPATLAFGRLSEGESEGQVLDVREIPVYCFFGEQPLEILGHRLTHNKSAKHYEVSIGALSPGQLEEEPDALSGCLVRVAVKSGLPLGEFRQTIELSTNLKSSPTIEIPVVGKIGKDFSIVGKGWKNGVLTIGTVSSREGCRRELFLIAGGPHHKEVQFKPGPRVPDLLDVKLADTVEFAGGKSSRTVISIEVPKGSRRANYLGTDNGKLGLITILSNHPQVPDLKIRVRFAVRGE